jgi:hypothetical protein
LYLQRIEEEQLLRTVGEDSVTNGQSSMTVDHKTN